MAGYVPEWLRASHKKSGASKIEHGKREMPNFHSGQGQHPLTQEMKSDPHTSAAYFANGGIVRMADGRDPTEAELKQMGLDASNAEREGAGRPGIVEGFKNLIGRFKEGNIDDPNSLAYERYGAGRGRREYEDQKAFAENAKMQGSGMRNAGMVMRGDKMAAEPSPATSAVPAMPEVETKDISPKPSAEYKMDMDSMKRSSMSGGANLPQAESTPRPMSTEPNRRAKPAPAPRKRGVETGTVPAEPKASTGKQVVIPDNKRPPVDNTTRKEKPGARGGENEKRKSKPYPAEQAVQNLGKRFKEADDALKADPKNASKKKARDEAKMRYEKAAKELR